MPTVAHDITESGQVELCTPHQLLPLAGTQATLPLSGMGSGYNTSNM